jgi:hypothetical protein
MQRLFRIDMLALTAVIAGAAALRFYCQIELHPGVWDFGLADNAFINGARKARHFVEALLPVVFGFAAVGFARVLREPAPNRRLLFRQPGVAACGAIMAAFAAGWVNIAVWAVGRLEFSSQWGTFSAAMVISQGERHLSHCVFAVWAFLAVGGLWTPGRNWVNWLGCTIGSLAAVNSALWYWCSQ